VGSLLYTLHVLGAVLWVGGMAFAVLALAPSLGSLEPPQRLALLSGVFRRFFLVVWHAMPAVLLTGWALLFVWYGGFRGAGWHVHVMHLTGLAMGAVYLAIALGPWREMRAALAAGVATEAGAAAGRIRRLVTLNLTLGLVTVAVAAWGRFSG
jgi:uncharacterized membrane protein